MKEYFHELGSEQWIDDDLNWNCTCLWGTVGRFKENSNRPCCCIWSALNKLSWKKIQEKKQNKNEKNNHLPVKIFMDPGRLVIRPLDLEEKELLKIQLSEQEDDKLLKLVTDYLIRMSTKRLIDKFGVKK